MLLNGVYFGRLSVLQVEFLEDLDAVVLLAALVVLLEQVLDLALLDLRDLLLELLLQLAQDLALAEALADAAHAAHVLVVLLRGDQVELVLLLALRVQVLLVLEGLQHVFEVDLRGRRRLRALRLGAQRLDLLEVLVELVGRLVEVGLLDGRLAAEFLLQLADEICEPAALVPLEEGLVVDFAGAGLDERVLHPLGDVDDGPLPGEVAQENAEWRRRVHLEGQAGLGAEDEREIALMVVEVRLEAGDGEALGELENDYSSSQCSIPSVLQYL